MEGKPGDLEERLRALEMKTQEDRVELEQLRFQVQAKAKHVSRGPKPKPKPESFPRLRLAFWALVFLVGAGVTFGTVVYEMHWHWAFGLMLAPIGGAALVLLGAAGVTI